MNVIDKSNLNAVSGGDPLTAGLTLGLTAVTVLVTAAWILGTTMAERDNNLSCPAPGSGP